MHDAQRAVERMRASLREFMAQLEDVSDSQWRLRPAGEEWSLAETAEHVALATQGTLARLERQLLASPLAPGSPRFDDAEIGPEMFEAPAPALAVPSGRFARRAEGVAALRAAADGIAAWVARTEADLRAYGLSHPVFGVFDGVQWILFVAAHADNHTPQLRSLRAHPELTGAT